MSTASPPAAASALPRCCSLLTLRARGRLPAGRHRASPRPRCPGSANGSLVDACDGDDGRLGAHRPALRRRPEWFQPRPSAAGDGYDPLASGGVQPRARRTRARRRESRSAAPRCRARTASTPSDVPPDAVTASGSGLDPHISPAYAGSRWRGSPGARASPRTTSRPWSTSTPRARPAGLPRRAARQRAASSTLALQALRRSMTRANDRSASDGRSGAADG